MANRTKKTGESRPDGGAGGDPIDVVADDAGELDEAPEDEAPEDEAPAAAAPFSEACAEKHATGDPCLRSVPGHKKHFGGNVGWWE